MVEIEYGVQDGLFGAVVGDTSPAFNLHDGATERLKLGSTLIEMLVERRGASSNDRIVRARKKDVLLRTLNHSFVVMPLQLKSLNEIDTTEIVYFECWALLIRLVKS
jgi:hypothetical protein